MGWIKRRAREIESRQWREVAHYLGRDERPINYIRVFGDGQWGWLYLTDARLFWTAVTRAGGEEPVGDRALLALADFGRVEDEPRSMVALAKDESQHVRFDVAADVPKTFVRLFCQEARQATHAAQRRGPSEPHLE